MDLLWNGLNSLWWRVRCSDVSSRWSDVCPESIHYLWLVQSFSSGCFYAFTYYFRFLLFTTFFLCRFLLFGSDNLFICFYAAHFSPHVFISNFTKQSFRCRMSRALFLFSSDFSYLSDLFIKWAMFLLAFFFLLSFLMETFSL